MKTSFVVCAALVLAATAPCSGQSTPADSTRYYRREISELLDRTALYRALADTFARRERRCKASSRFSPQQQAPRPARRKR